MIFMLMVIAVVALGLICYCCCRVAGWEDRQMEKLYRQELQRNKQDPD